MLPSVGIVSKVEGSSVDSLKDSVVEDNFVLGKVESS